MKIWSPEIGEEDIDLTPMIDVVFLLIVFFMTVANMITSEKVEIDMPVATHSVIPEEFGGRSTITVMQDGSIFAGVRPVDLDGLEEILQREINNDPELKVYVRADSFTEHQFVNDVMEVCAAVGIYNVIFAAYQSDK
ncbi:MAG TPA: biopolymer transporter ExbD [Opitutales bacterium]|nr:biopolymer transporter ExbD [Opitutales bacterium]